MSQVMKPIIYNRDDLANGGFNTVYKSLDGRYLIKYDSAKSVWVLVKSINEEILDHDYFRHDLAESNGFVIEY